MHESVLRLAVIFEGGLLALAFGIGWLIGSPPFRDLSLSWRALGLGVVATALPLLFFWWIAQSQWPPLRRLMVDVDRIAGVFSGCSRGEIALVSLLAGLAEEGLFRGVIQAWLLAWVSPWAAILGASVLFGLGHYITPTYALVAGLFGVYLGTLLLATENLLPPVIAHALYDFVALNYLWRKHKLREAAGD